MRYAITIIATLALVGCFRVAEAHEPEKCWWHWAESVDEHGNVSEVSIVTGAHAWGTTSLDGQGWYWWRGLSGEVKRRKHAYVRKHDTTPTPCPPQSAQEQAASQTPPDLTGGQ